VLNLPVEQEDVRDIVGVSGDQGRGKALVGHKAAIRRNRGLDADVVPFIAVAGHGHTFHLKFGGTDIFPPAPFIAVSAFGGKAENICSF
jgi:hypothetical protein